ncbi:MAG: YihY/virulence factor BrkB family protein [Bacteroidota bacterium]
MASRVKEIFGMIKQAGSEFIDDDAIKLSASLAYFTIFSIGPLLLVIITLLSFFYERSLVTEQVFHQLSTMIGSAGAVQLKAILENIDKQHNPTIFGVVGVIILLFGATGIFTEIQGSINYIWSIRAKPEKGWLKYLSDRLLSFSLIIGIGFLMLVTLMINLLMDMLTTRMNTFFGGDNILLVKGINIVLLFAVVTFLFAVIYKVLPDARIAWRDALTGATCTGLLFLGGKFLISYYIASAKTTETYGAAASIIILLTWVFFSALILYFGAEFTKVYALKCGKGITLYKTAVFIVKREEKELPVKKIRSEEQVAEGKSTSSS